MTFNLVKKLKEELDFLRRDLVGYKSEYTRITEAKEAAQAAADLEFSRAMHAFNEQINNVSGAMGYCEKAIEEYEETLAILESVKGEENDNRQ